MELIQVAGKSSVAGAAAPLPGGVPREPEPSLPRRPAPEKRRVKPGRWMLGVLLVLVIGSVAYVVIRRAKTSPAAAGAAAIRTAKAARGDLQANTRVSGTVAAKEFAAIVAPRMRGHRGGGQFDMILMKLATPGSPVKKGDVVAEFDRQAQLLMVDDHRARVVQAEADVTKRQAELAILKDTADQNVRRSRADMDKAGLDLKTVEIRSEIDAEKLKLAAEETTARYKQLQEEIRLLAISQQADIRVQEIQRDRAKVDQQRAQMNADRMIVRASIDGVVVMQLIWRSGQFAQVQEGDQVFPGSYFMQVVNPASMVVNALVNQAQSQELRLGQTAEIRLDAYPDSMWTGRLISMGAMATSAGMGGRGGSMDRYVRSVPVRFSIDAKDSRIIPDLSASATVLLGQEKNTVIVPREALEQRDGSFYVLVRRPQGGWESRQVQLGLRNETHTVLRAGLSEGEEVALERPSSPGQ